MKRSITLTCFLGLALPAVGQAQEEDDLVRQAFVQAFGKRPADSPSTALVPSPEIDAAITAGRSAVAAPSDRALQAEFTERLASLIDSQVRGNLHELLFVVFKESMAELQEDKKYYLEKLARMNQMGVALSDYLEELAGASRELGEMERGTSGPARSARTVSITVRTFDPVWVESLAGPSVHNRSIVCDPCLTTREATLNAEQIQREQESVLGVQRRLQATLQEAEMRHAELDMGTEAVVRMLAEVLEAVDEESGGAVRGTLSGPTLQR